MGGAKKASECKAAAAAVPAPAQASAAAGAGAAGALQAVPGDQISATNLGKINAQQTLQNFDIAAGPLPQQKYAVPSVVVSIMITSIVVGRQMLRSHVSIHEQISD